MKQYVERDDGDTVAMLVDLAFADPTAMAASEEFLELWQKFESQLIEAQAADGSAALQPLRNLIGRLPVGHIDKASALRVDANSTLLELCAFKVVSASVEEHFPEVADMVGDARAVLSSPTSEQSVRFTGTENDLDEFFAWIDAGKPADDVWSGPVSDDTPDHDERLFDWLLMMEKERACDSRGRTAEYGRLDEDSDYDEYRLDTGMLLNDELSQAVGGKERSPEQASGDPPLVHGASPWVSSSGDAGFDAGHVDEEDVFSSSATEVDACLEEWLTSDVAKQLMEFLEKELPQ